MPVTPYHFGPSGFIGLLLKRYLDLPVFVLANVVIDIEVPFSDLFDSPFPHRLWHFHSLPGSFIIGAIFGFAAYFLLGKLLSIIMSFLRLDYKPVFLKMILSGAIGGAFHVFVDSIYHWDVQLLWPVNDARPLWNLLTKAQVKQICILFWIAAVILYIIYLLAAYKKSNPRSVSDQS